MWRHSKFSQMFEYQRNRKWVFVKMTKNDKKLLIELICEKQTKMIAKDHTKYSSEKYKHLEKLKVLIKDM